MRLLAVDVGGTHARLALFEARDGRLSTRPLRERTERSASYSGFLPLLRRLLTEVEGPFDGIGVAVAGPVVEGVARLPNLGWEVRRAELEVELGLERPLLINDFDAVGHAVTVLTRDDFEELQRGEPSSGGAIAILGPGTGLGHAFLVWEGGRYRVHPSEGGHADFAPRGPLQVRLLDYLTGRFGRASWERVLSGPGLENAYRFLADAEGEPESDETRKRLRREDAARVISERALDGSDPLCARALDLFLSVLGAQAANFALAVQATGGVYIGGGIAPKILPRLRSGPFLEAFRDRGRMSGLLERIPVCVILEERAGLIGAAAAALQAGTGAASRAAPPAGRLRR